jgi:hypothetical protein
VSSTVESTITFAKAVLDAEPGHALKIAHNFNYLNRKKKSFKIKNDGPSRIIYTGPGKARLVEILLPDQDPRAGRFPQHNSEGPFPENLEVLPSLTMDFFEEFHTIDSLEEIGFEKYTCSLTKKKIAKLQSQFCNLSNLSFNEMMCLNHQEEQKRDFDIWHFTIDQELVIAYVNPQYNFVQFFQTIIRDDMDRIIDLKHVVCEAGLPLVMNQTTIDQFGNLRNIAHVGITGSQENAFRNSLERFDDGTIVWTTSDYKYGRNLTGSAVMKDSGEVIILEGSDRELAEFSARNLGAESIDPYTLAWTGTFDEEACMPEMDDKFIVRREYKAAVRDKVSQIVDGACIPGLEPIFDVR